MRRLLSLFFNRFSNPTTLLLAEPISDVEEDMAPVEEKPRFDDVLVELFRDHLQKTHGHIAQILPGQCLNVAYNVIDQIVPIFRHYFPEESDVTPVIWIGNVIVADDEKPWCNDEQAREFAANPVVDKNVLKDYHAWISFDRLIVDLTLLYSLDDEHGLQRNRVLVSANEVFIDYGGRVEFLPYNSFSKTDLDRLAQRSLS